MIFLYPSRFTLRCLGTQRRVPSETLLKRKTLEGAEKLFIPLSTFSYIIIRVTFRETPYI